MTEHKKIMITNLFLIRQVMVETKQKKIGGVDVQKKKNQNQC